MTSELFVKDVMSRAVTIAKSAKITEALDKMIDEGIDPLIVTNNSSVSGTISRKAIAEKLGTRKNMVKSPTSIHVANSVDPEYTSVYPDQDLDVLVPLLQRYKLVVVFDQNHKLVGQVTMGDLLRVQKPEGRVEDVMEPACTIDVEERVVHLRRRMLDDGINRFVVTDSDRAVGIVTETDVAIAMRQFREVVEDRYQDARIRNLLVRDIMSSPLITVDRGTMVGSVVETMLSKNISSIPVIDECSVVGVVTRAALVNAL